MKIVLNIVLATLMIWGLDISNIWGEQKSSPDTQQKVFEYEGILLTSITKTKPITIKTKDRKVFLNLTEDTVILTGVQNVSGLPISSTAMNPKVGDKVSVTCEGEKKKGRIVCSFLEVYAHR